MIEKITLSEALAGLDSASSANYLYSELSSKSGKMPIDDIRKLIYSNPSYRQQNVDVDTLDETGVYYLTSGITNATEWSFLIVFRITNDECIQINIHNSGSSFIRRVKSGGEWKKWY